VFGDLGGEGVLGRDLKLLRQTPGPCLAWEHESRFGEREQGRAEEWLDGCAKMCS